LSGRYFNKKFKNGLTSNWFRKNQFPHRRNHQNITALNALAEEKKPKAMGIDFLKQ